MAEAKLWWNGSQWVTEETDCVDSLPGGSSSWARVHYTIKIIAYNDATIKMSATLRATSNYGQAFINSGTKTVKSGGTTIGTGTFTADVTQYDSFAWSGNVTCGMNEWGSTTYHAGSANNQSGTINVTESPFLTVTYNANGGTGAVGTQTVLRNISTAITPEVTPTRENYQLIGWNTEADGTGTSYGNGANISTGEDTTLYAQWSQTAFAVSINADEGSTITLDGQSFTNQTTTIYKPAGSYDVAITANSGFIVTTRTPASDGSISISDNTTVLSATAQRVGCHLDDGNNWVQAIIYYDDGEKWNMLQTYFDNGASWELVY